MAAAVELQNLEINFGAPRTGCLKTPSGLRLDLAAPLLGGPSQDALEAGEDTELLSVGPLSIIRSPDRTIGLALHACQEGIQQGAAEIYTGLLGALNGHSLYRVWNFIPRINALADGLENYRAFNLGRHAAFRDHFGLETMESVLPAAAAVGIENGPLVLVFVAGTAPVSFLENPAQIPAYRYPATYGPASPSFARAAVVRPDWSAPIGYLSGTSSIRGHETIGQDDLDTQFAVTWENVTLVRKRMALGDGAPLRASYRIYLRHRSDFPRVKALFEEQVGPEVSQTATFLQADICRQPLRLEIEATFTT